MPELTVLYDGHCALCRASVDRVRRLDRMGRIELLDLHDLTVATRFPQVDREKALRLMQAVDRSGRVSSGVDAYVEIARRLSGMWNTVGWTLRVPGIHTVAGWVYGWVARNRYRWNREACANGSCSLHGRIPGSRQK